MEIRANVCLVMNFLEEAVNNVCILVQLATVKPSALSVMQDTSSIATLVVMKFQPMLRLSSRLTVKLSNVPEDVGNALCLGAQAALKDFIFQRPLVSCVTELGKIVRLVQAQGVIHAILDTMSKKLIVLYALIAVLIVPHPDVLHVKMDIIGTELNVQLVKMLLAFFAQAINVLNVKLDSSPLWANASSV